MKIFTILAMSILVSSLGVHLNSVWKNCNANRKTPRRGPKGRAESAAGLGQVGAQTGAERDGLSKLKYLASSACYAKTLSGVHLTQFLVPYVTNVSSENFDSTIAGSLSKVYPLKIIISMSFTVLVPRHMILLNFIDVRTLYTIEF